MTNESNTKASVKRSVVLSLEESEATNTVATEERRSFNSVVRQALKEFLERRLAKREAA